MPRDGDDTLAQRRLAELDQLKHASGGIVSPRAVVDFARNSRTALHSWFEWNNSAAAEKYRLHQARLLINVLVTVVPGTKIATQAYVSLAEDRHEDGGYRAIVDVLSDADLRGRLLAMALAELRAFRSKYRRLQELGDLFASIDTTMSRHASRRAGSAGRRTARQGKAR